MRKNDGHDPIQCKPVEVTLRPNESADRLIRRFVKKVRNEGIMDELRDRRSYMKPSVKKRLKQVRARSRKED